MTTSIVPEFLLRRHVDHWCQRRGMESQNLQRPTPGLNPNPPAQRQGRLAKYGCAHTAARPFCVSSATAGQTTLR